MLGLDNLVLFASAGSAERLREAMPNGCQLVLVPSADERLWRRVLAEQVILPRLLRDYRVDVLFCPANTIPLWTDVPVVTTFQNAAPFCAHADASMTLRLRWWLLGGLMRQSALRSRRVIFLSRYFLDLFVARFAFDRSRGAVIHRTSRAPVVRVGEASRSNEVLSISHFYPYKNLLELIEGFIIARRARNAPWTLLLAGGEYVGDYGARIRARLQELRAGETEVRILGDLPAEDAAKMLERCGIFAFSSVCENCPTALVEALRAGAPIACSNVGVMPEIAGNAAEYFNPYSPPDIARVLGSLIDSPERRRLLQKDALTRGGEFPSPREAASRTLALIRETGFTATGNKPLSALSGT